MDINNFFQDQLADLAKQKADVEKQKADAQTSLNIRLQSLQNSVQPELDKCDADIATLQDKIDTINGILTTFTDNNIDLTTISTKSVVKQNIIN